MNGESANWRHAMGRLERRLNRLECETQGKTEAPYVVRPGDDLTAFEGRTVMRLPGKLSLEEWDRRYRRKGSEDSLH